MERLSIDEIASLVMGNIINRTNEYAYGVQLDSRKVKDGDIFFALRGTVSDGHKYLKSAEDNGANILITEEDTECSKASVIKVKDSYEALVNLAVGYKSKFKIPFIALTGSCGKTTTKDMVASVLGVKYKVMKTNGNFNNSTGVPLTLLSLKENDEIGVVEMGMSALGEISKLVKMVYPDIALITNVGSTHIEFLKTRENIFKAKCEILETLDESGIAVVNGDNDFLQTLKSDKFKVVKVGINNGDLKAYDINQNENGISFKVDINGREERFSFGIPGIHNVYNALFAVYVGLKFGLSVKDIQKGFDGYLPSANRMEIIKLDKITLINDTYNSNPDALKSAVGVLKQIADEKRKILVCGQMGELGEESSKLHRECGEYIGKEKIDIIYLIGEETKHLRQGLKKAGILEENIKYFNNKEDLTSSLLNIIKDGDNILFKGSRSVGLENVVESIKERYKN